MRHHDPLVWRSLQCLHELLWHYLCGRGRGVFRGSRLQRSQGYREPGLLLPIHLSEPVDVPLFRRWIQLCFSLW